MSEPIGVGDWVECVESSDNDQIKTGTVWLVSKIYTNDGSYCCDYCEKEDTDHPALVLHDCGHGLQCACGFRPIYRPSSSLIESLKAPMHADDHKRELVRLIAEPVPINQDIYK